MENNTWFVYLLRCCDGTYYCGSTKDVKRRLVEHNISKKGAKYTRSRRPVSLIGFKSAPDRSSAQKIEASVKKMRRPDKLKFFT